MDQAKLGELVTEEERSIEIVREGDGRVLTVIERKLGIEVHRLCRECIHPIEDGGRGVSMDVIVVGDLPEFIYNRCWDDDLVPGETECEWIGIVVSNDPETHESGGICDEPRHLRVGDLVDEVLVQLLFQHSDICRLFGADERFELLEGDLIVVIGGGDLLSEGVVVSGVLEVLPKRGHEDICSVFPEDCSQCVGAVDEPIGGPKLHALLIGAHDVYIVSQFT
uniref:Uncharacterized protein n=1 Tax=uncultured haloarchaeon TaxID=160804 RepID=A5YS99_9EURY|nr:hypothetical protein [uncultured haloarchaeon]